MPVEKIEKVVLSRGYKNCLFVIEKLKETGKEIFTIADIHNMIRKHIGMSQLTITRYMSYLLVNKFLAKRMDGSYEFKRDQ